jgi:hypothetical protein
VIERRISPAGDPFTAAAKRRPDPGHQTRACFACWEGLVYIGHMVEEDGEEVEQIEAVPCKRCRD